MDVILLAEVRAVWFICAATDNNIGDDAHLRVWSVANLSCIQDITLPEWGQILAIEILEDRLQGDRTLFVATGKGNLTILPSDSNGQYVRQDDSFRLHN